MHRPSQSPCENPRLTVPQMILIGAPGRNSGKTLLACDVIAACSKQYPVYALKIIGIDRPGEPCHRGGDGCGMCTNLKGAYALTEDTDPLSDKDTSRMLAAGAQRAFLLRSLKASMLEAFTGFLRDMPQNALLVCESNTLRTLVRPGVFLFAGPADGAMKPSARQVVACADYVLPATEPAARYIRIQADEHGRVTAEPAG